jgi:hypothetical protein
MGYVSHDSSEITPHLPHLPILSVFFFLESDVFLKNNSYNYLLRNMCHVAGDERQPHMARWNRTVGPG